MPSYFYLELDRTPPASVSIVIDGGQIYSTDQLVDLAISTADASKVGYTMKIWGDVDPVHNANVQTTEGASAWINYQESLQIKLSAGDGNKNVYLKIRDEVYNVSSQVSDSINLNTTVPQVTTSAISVAKISENTGKNEATFSFTSDVNFTEYKVKIVSSESATHDTGVLIGMANGSTGMSGTGTFSSATPINCKINGTDYATASSVDAIKCVKVFVRNEAGLWSV